MKRKNAVKGALIADLRRLNYILPKPLPFRLPCLGQLDSLLSACRYLKLNLFFIKLDISNMYWACKLPQSGLTISGSGCGASPSLCFVSHLAGHTAPLLLEKTWRVS